MSFLLAALAGLGSFVLAGQGRVRAAVADDVRLNAPRDVAPAGGDLSDLVLPGGLRASLAAIKDFNPPDRSQFLLEVIRRVHNLGSSPEGSRDATLVALLAHLDAVAHNPASSDAGETRTSETRTNETLPLPLTPSIWTGVVFAGRATWATLATDILRSRNASLLYVGLLSLDADTRAFLAAQQGLLADLSSRLAPAFVIASPGLRVSGGQLRLPGGDRAVGAWEALVGRRVGEPVEFVRALLAHDNGRAAWFVGALGRLTPAQLDRTLDLDAPDLQRVAAMRRLYGVFVRVAADWRMETRTFWRPGLDPTLLAAWLPTDANGRFVLPGTRMFWQAVFADASMPADAAARAGRESPVDFSWLADQVFGGAPVDHRGRLQQVLFASRLPTPGDARALIDTADAVRAAARYPALVATLERLHVSDPALYAQAARRAADLSSIDAGPRAVRATAQFQGLLAVIARATARGGLDTASAQALVRSLVAVERAPHGDYDGRLVDWLGANLATLRADAPEPTLERALVQLVSGPPPADGRIIEWEGSRYRVDLPAAETRRIERLLGDNARPWFTSARTLMSLAAGLADPAQASGGRAQAADTLTNVARHVGWTDPAPDPRATAAIAQYRSVAQALARRTRAPSADRTAAATLRVLSDDLFARGLIELTYAIALGQSDRAWITADEAAAGHDFGFGADGARRGEATWRRPVAGADTRREWRATGSLLGLEVSLSELGLVRLSTRPPPRRPTINEEDRRTLVETVSLIEPAAIVDADRDRIVAAIASGRARLAATRTAADASAIADDLGLGAERRTLLAWLASRDPERLAASLSPGELLRLGLPAPRAGARSVDVALHAWGATAEAIMGCLCQRVASDLPWEALAGRWGSGLFASAFPDLNLRVAELLATLHMPSELLGPVLASATLDLANSVSVRGQDDRRSLVEFSQALTPARVEQYLALLTTGGPLVPLDGSEDVTASRPGAPR